MTTAEAVAARKQKSDLVPFDDDTIGLCQCATCPTHEQCKVGEVVFCSSGMSDNVNDMQKKGCQCPTCEVFSKYNLGGGFFCIEGEVK